MTADAPGGSLTYRQRQPAWELRLHQPGRSGGLNNPALLPGLRRLSAPPQL